ncbi:MAG: redoxin domain-containing protein [Culturomica sp.]|jgi:thioredoxin|nr:redoxin domain-containing protein [Culturomica sp.]
MKNVMILLATLLLTGLLTVAKAQSVEKMNKEVFLEKIWDFEQNKEWKYKGTKPVIIDMYADWCGPCKKLSPILEQIQKDFGDKLQIYKVNTDQERLLAQLFQVSSIPLLIFIPVEGRPIAVAGLRPQADLEKIIAEQLQVKK